MYVLGMCVKCREIQLGERQLSGEKKNAGMTDHSVIGAGGIEESRNGDNRMAWAKTTRERFRDWKKKEGDQDEKRRKKTDKMKDPKLFYKSSWKCTGAKSINLTG